jgi:hypothetical protein
MGNGAAMIVHAFHGWASDASIWDLVANELGSEVVLRRYDRGYFGVERDVPADEHADVIITHSMGLLFVPVIALASTKRVIILNGFSHFPSSDSLSKRRTLSMLSLMKSNLQRDPVAQVHAFCAKAGFRLFEISPDDINIARLASDLDLLATSLITPNHFRESGIIHFVHATGDPIVNTMAIQDSVVNFQQAKHHHIESDTHNLLEFHADLVRKLIFDP